MVYTHACTTRPRLHEASAELGKDIDGTYTSREWLLDNKQAFVQYISSQSTVLSECYYIASVLVFQAL